jgi:outer membrane lipoprotein-sorting protein
VSRLLVTLLLLLPLFSAPAAQESAEWVARQVRDRSAGRDSRAELRMRLFDSHGRVRERALTMLRMRGEKEKGDRALIRFTYPNDIRNTAFLVWEHPDTDDERFLYLPALGRVRRISGQEKDESFVGSDLSYEDIGGRDISDYTYAFTADDTSWLAPDGSKRPAWLLESRAKDKNAELPRSVSFVLKDSFVISAADIFNRRNERVKHFEVRKLERVEGIWTVLDLVMSNERDNTRTELTTSSIDYNVGLTENDFSRRQLEAPAR